LLPSPTRYRLSFHQPDFRKLDFRKPGKPRIALTAYHAKITTRRNISEWSALEKPVSPPPAESSIPLEILC